MQADTLVLNKGFKAVHIAGWQQSLSLVYQGHAEVVDENYQTYDFKDWCELSAAMKDSPNGFVQTSSLRIKKPDVIRLTRYEKLPSSEVKFTKRNLFQTYGYKCAYCSHKFKSEDLTYEHIVPRSKGGGTNWKNIVPACWPCNRKKADRTPAEAGMKLLVKPERPVWKGPEDMIMRLPGPKRVAWQNFIDELYWDTELEQD
jgi:5-methylcytosine-specific restriction endonuclease McrA